MQIEDEMVNDIMGEMNNNLAFRVETRLKKKGLLNKYYSKLSRGLFSV